MLAARRSSRTNTRLGYAQVAAEARPTLRSVGIIRDADDNPQGSFDSVCNSLRSVGYEPPAAHAEFSDATPSVGVFIVPDGSQPGAIETLCRRSVEGEDAAKCADEYMECLTTHDALQSRNADKTFTHAYLAAMERSRSQSWRRRSTRSMGFPIPGVRCPLSVCARSLLARLA